MCPTFRKAFHYMLYMPKYKYQWAVSSNSTFSVYKLFDNYYIYAVYVIVFLSRCPSNSWAKNRYIAQLKMLSSTSRCRGIGEHIQSMGFGLSVAKSNYWIATGSLQCMLRSQEKLDSLVWKDALELNSSPAIPLVLWQRRSVKTCG